ncbi:glycosyltransferase family 1 protein [Paenibacillus sp. GYB004]|uniref:glycosyltransferase family 4 protein n=1 Tax=Paenibacillus sp. GYB004 TaxID=2994393 RepID=UPI002F968F35
MFLDAQPLLGPKSGVFRYTYCLYDMLKSSHLKVFPAFNSHLQRISKEHLPFTFSQANIINQFYPYRIIKKIMRPNVLYNFPYDMFTKEKADIFHGTNFVHTPTIRGKSIVTIHDLAFMLFPETTNKHIYNHHMKWVPYSVEKCDHIIAISQQTKNDIVSLLNVPESKIDVIPLAGGNSFKPLDKSEYKIILNKYHLPDQYILFVGTLEPRKNLLGLLKAFLLLKKNSNCFGKLVIVGAQGWKYSAIYDWVQQHSLENDVIFLGFVDDEDLVHLYNGATVFVLPSIYEGFGIPLLEAMQCGTPVIGSDVSSIPEVIGDAGELVPPFDYEGWAEKLHLFLTNSSLRKHYSRLALKRSRDFSWNKVAHETIAVYEKIYDS